MTKLLKISEAPETLPCANPCCVYLAEKQISTGSFILKGSGWYKTDFKGDKPS